MEKMEALKSGEFIDFAGYAVADNKAREKINNMIDMLNTHEETQQTHVKKLQSYVTPQMYGAIGDGVTDDTSAIQQAIDSVMNGGTIFFPAGVYYVTAPIKYYSNQTFEGNNAQLLNGCGDHNYMLCPANPNKVGGYNGTHNVLIKNLEFNGNGKICTCVMFSHAKNVRIENCRIHNISGWHLLEFNAVLNGWAVNCLFENYQMEDGTEMIQIDASSEGGSPNLEPYDGTPSKYIHILHCNFSNSKNYGSADNGNGAAAIGNHNNVPSRDILIDGCLFEHMHACTRFLCGVGIHIKNCDVQNCRNGFIFNHGAVMDTLSRCRYVTINNVLMFLNHAMECKGVFFDGYGIGGTSDTIFITGLTLRYNSVGGCIPIDARACEFGHITNNILLGNSGGSILYTEGKNIQVHCNTFNLVYTA